MPKGFFFVSTLVELIVIVYLGLNILYKKNNFAKAMSINKINKNSIVFQPNEKLKFFYEPKPDEKINDWVPYKATYTINSDLLNERFNYSFKKPPKTYRIITLGDSFTFGVYVDTKNNWTEILENELNSKIICNKYNIFEVINLGVPGYDVQYATERFKNRGAKYHPDLVLWLLKNDDLEQINELMLVKERKYRKEMIESGKFDRLVRVGNYYPSWVKAMDEVYNEYGTIKILSYQTAILNKFSEDYRNSLSIITFPNIKEKYKKILREYTSLRGKGYFYEHLFDIYQDQNFFFPNDYHPTIEGHIQIAEDLFNYLIKNNIIPCINGK